MFFEGNNPILRITDVSRMSWEGGKFDIAPRNYSALVFRIRGSAFITVRGKKIRVGANEVLYMPQKLGYYAEYTDTEIIVVHFVAENDDNEAEVYTFENSEPIFRRFLQMIVCRDKKKPGYRVRELSILYDILGTISEMNASTEVPSYFLRALSEIHSRFRDGELGIEDVCRSSGVSGTALRVLCRRYLGKRPTEYITDLRLEYARNLISSGESVESAARKSGFNDTKYFARVVKKHFGCTPRELKLYGK